jgi:7-carboxy-7-deazaguanine synthase (Cx14CxxC type)
MAVCQFCDTDFVGTDGDGGGRFRSAEDVAAHVDALAGATRFVVCTGGEPLLQLDPPLIDALHARGFEIAIETNGTLPVPDGIDWVCVSPKADSDLVVTHGDELKLVYRQEGGEPERYAGLGFRHFFLQPMDGPDRERFTVEAIAYCQAHPQWRLSIQTHKYLGIP